MAPSEDFFRNIAEALKFLLNRDKGGLEVLKTGLLEDDWKQSEFFACSLVHKEAALQRIDIFVPSFETSTDDCIEFLSEEKQYHPGGN